MNAADPVALQNLAIVRAEKRMDREPCFCNRYGEDDVCPKHNPAANPDVHRCTSCDWWVLREDCDKDGDCPGCQVRFAAEKEAA